MKRRSWTVVIGIVLMTGILAGCKSTPTEASVLQSSTACTSGNVHAYESRSQTGLKMTIGGISFDLELDNNDTAAAFRNILPATLSMQELNKNEKYIYLDTSMPTDSSAVGSIKAGDLMLYGDNCIVLFYKSFSTSYSYTRIGHITDTDNLAAAVGSDAIDVTFS